MAEMGAPEVIVSMLADQLRGAGSHEEFWDMFKEAYLNMAKEMQGDGGQGKQLPDMEIFVGRLATSEFPKFMRNMLLEGMTGDGKYAELFANMEDAPEDLA